MTDEQTDRRERVTGHYRAVMAALQLGAVAAADAYLRDVRSAEGQQVHDDICAMIAIRLQIPPLES